MSAACACAWLVIGARLMRRPQLPRHAAAGRALAVSFLAGGAHIGVNAVLGALVLAGADEATVALPSAWAGALLGVLTVGGLVAYLAHLLTGSPRAVPAVAGVYVVQTLGLVAILRWLGPVGAHTTGWTVRFDFAHATDAANSLLATVILAPAALASAAYLSLLPKTSDPTARWRIALVGGGFVLWIAAAVAGRFTGTGSSGLALARLAAVLAAGAVVLAYSPPAFARARWGVRALASEIAPPIVPDPEREARRAAVIARMRDLI